MSLSKADQLGEKYLAKQRDRAKRMQRGSTLARAAEPMRHRSEKRQRIYDEQYLPQRERFLAERPWCEMNILGVCPRGRHEATEIQHLVQRSLDPSIENLLDESMWLPSCHDANTWAGNHPAEARDIGVEVTPAERDAIREGGTR